MSEIEKGEYIRTEKGYIFNNLSKKQISGIKLLNKQYEAITKYSNKQKELIQEGDILEYQINKISCTKIGKVKKYKDARSFREYLGVEGFNLEQITILRILTKEKFEEESYKVGEQMSENIFNDKEYLKIKKFKKIEKEYEELYEEVCNIIEKKYKDFESGDSIGDIVDKAEIPSTAQKNEDGTYTTYHQVGEDWGNGIVYLPLNNDGYEEFLEIYYST